MLALTGDLLGEPSVLSYTLNRQGQKSYISIVSLEIGLSRIGKSATGLLVTLLTVFVLLALSCSDGASPEEELSNLVYLVIDTVDAGERFPMPIRFENSVPIRALAIPLYYSAASIDCDSISFVGSRLTAWDFNASVIDEENNLVQFLMSTTGDPLVAGSGLLATLHFRAHGDSPTLDMVIDTTWIARNLELHFTGIGDFDSLIIPTFTPGHVHIDSIQ